MLSSSLRFTKVEVGESSSATPVKCTEASLMRILRTPLPGSWITISFAVAFASTTK